jgi:hypothetical protein
LSVIQIGNTSGYIAIFSSLTFICNSIEQYLQPFKMEGASQFRVPENCSEMVILFSIYWSLWG